MRPGRLVRLTACSAFKIGLVLGPSRSVGKLRVVTYSHNKRRWSKPRAVPSASCADVVTAALKPGHRRTIAHALEDGAEMGAWVYTA